MNERVEKEYRSFLLDYQSKKSDLEKFGWLSYYYYLLKGREDVGQLLSTYNKELVFDVLDSFCLDLWRKKIDESCEIFEENPESGGKAFKRALETVAIYSGVVNYGKAIKVLSGDEDLDKIHKSLTEIMQLDDGIYDKHVRSELGKNGEIYEELPEYQKKSRIKTLCSVNSDFISTVHKATEDPFWFGLYEGDVQSRDYYNYLDKFYWILGNSFSGDEYLNRQGNVFVKVRENEAYLKKLTSSGNTYRYSLKQLEVRSMFGYCADLLLGDGYREVFVCLPFHYKTFRLMDGRVYRGMKKIYDRKLNYVTSIHTMPLDYLDYENLAAGYISNWVNKILMGLEEKHHILPVLRKQ